MGAHERVALAVVTAGGDPALVGEARASFDEALNAAPERQRLDPDELALRRALGVA